MYQNYSVGVSYGIPVPYHKALSPAFSNGSQIHITGTATGNRFEVNLKDYQDDVVFHFNPRFDDNVLVLNSAQQGSWGQEEHQTLPIYRGMKFAMTILGTDRSFRVSVNNSQVCEFYSRIPMYLAQQLEIKGEINLESIHTGSGAGSPGYPPMGGDTGYCPPPPQPTFGGDTAYCPLPPQPTFDGDMGYCPSPPSPTFGGDMGYCPPPPSATFGGDMGYCPPPPESNFSADMGYCPPPPDATFSGDFNTEFGYPSAPTFTGGSVPSIQTCRIHTGSRIFVRGFIPVGANRFELNFLQGYSDTDDIAFHFNPRFDSNKIVKNHRQNGQWGQEENQPFPSYMPLIQGSPIDLQIACETNRYTVFMNNTLIAEFYHKIPPGFVTALQYKGDIQVTSVGQI